MNDLSYYELPAPPQRVSAGTILARLVDGLAFRYRWATEGLSGDEMDFRPGPESMSLRELLEHVFGLVYWVDEHFDGEQRSSPPASSLQELRAQTLQRLEALSARVAEMSEAEIANHTITSFGKGDTYPFWNVINGPLSDALTHVGQVNAWRRLAGNPAPKANVFLGRPPEHTLGHS